MHVTCRLMNTSRCSALDLSPTVAQESPLTIFIRSDHHTTRELAVWARSGDPLEILLEGAHPEEIYVYDQYGG